MLQMRRRNACEQLYFAHSQPVLKHMRDLSTGQHARSTRAWRQRWPDMCGCPDTCSARRSSSRRAPNRLDIGPKETNCARNESQKVLQPGSMAMHVRKGTTRSGRTKSGATRSGATQVQIITKQRRKIVNVEHIGSTHTDVDGAVMVEIAKERIRTHTKTAGHVEFDIGDHSPTAASRLVLQRAYSRFLFDTLASVYDRLGFNTVVGDSVRRDLVIARIIEPSSKPDRRRRQFRRHSCRIVVALVVEVAAEPEGSEPRLRWTLEQSMNHESEIMGWVNFLGHLGEGPRN